MLGGFGLGLTIGDPLGDERGFAEAGRCMQQGEFLPLPGIKHRQQA